MHDTSNEVVRRLRSVDLRVTAPRVAELQELDTHPHISAKTAAQLVRASIGRVSTQAVYDVLAVCTRAGLVRCIEPAGSVARYETRAGDNHHHLICRVCDGVIDVDCVAGTRPCLTPSDDAGYLVDTAEVVFWGLCPQCRSGQAGEHPVPAEWTSQAMPASDLQRRKEKRNG